MPLLRLLVSENFPSNFVLKRIIVVASGCAEETLDKIRSFAEENELVLLIEESERHGKADAINKIIKNSLGSYNVFVNADALPARGSISELLVSVEDRTRWAWFLVIPFPA